MPTTTTSEPEDLRGEAIGRAWATTGVPLRYRDVPPSRTAPGWAYLTGPVGCGKTHRACMMARRFIEDGTREVGPRIYDVPLVQFVTASGYLDAVRRTYDGDDQTAAVARHADLLVLDDLGQEAPTSWACDQLFELVSARYNGLRPTIVTSQFAPEAIAARLSREGGRERAEALASRLMGCCEVYRLAGVDRRTA